MVISYFHTESKYRKEDGFLYVCMVYFGVSILKDVNYCNEISALLYWFCRTEVTKKWLEARKRYFSRILLFLKLIIVFLLPQGN